MKVNIMFLVSHFEKVGEGFFFIFHYFLIFIYTKSRSREDIERRSKSADSV